MKDWLIPIELNVQTVHEMCVSMCVCYTLQRHFLIAFLHKDGDNLSIGGFSRLTRAGCRVVCVCVCVCMFVCVQCAMCSVQFSNQSSSPTINLPLRLAAQRTAILSTSVLIRFVIIKKDAYRQFFMRKFETNIESEIVPSILTIVLTI